MSKKKSSLNKLPAPAQTTPPKVPGFQAAGIHAGIKKGKEKDLALLISDSPARVAGVFTQNQIKSAPVLLSQARIRSGLSKGIIINSGNANACTGDGGMRDAIAICRKTAKELATDEGAVLTASTGIIGERLPTKNIQAALPSLIQRLHPEGLEEAADAIQTTDRFRKFLWAETTVGKKKVTLCGMAKGAGMIRPNMATMLAFFLTDLKAPLPALQRLLKTGVERSFNRINVDGDFSTNDTVLLLANGLAENRTAKLRSPEYKAFADMLFPMMLKLATMIVQDGEGATKVVEIRIQGARSNKEANCLAYHVANSSLVKTSFYGEDPNWGRLMAALGSAGPSLSPEKIDISYDHLPIVNKGIAAKNQQRGKLKKVLTKNFFTVIIDLNIGKGSHSVLTSDLTHDYVSLNAEYPT